MNIGKRCNKFNCNELIGIKETYCDKHKQHTNKMYHKARTSSHDGREYKRFYDSKPWRSLRYQVLLDCGFICESCQVNEATIGDHIIPTKIRWDLRLSRDNIQGLCAECHNKKTAEDERMYF